MPRTTVELHPDLKVEIEPLTIKESFRADQITGDILGEKVTQAALLITQQKVSTICSIRTVNDAAVFPLGGDAGFDALCEKFTTVDLDKLAAANLKAEGIDIASLKNDSSAASTES